MQGVLWHHRLALADAGVRYPGHDEAAQFRAAVDVHPARYQEWTLPDVRDAWPWLVEQVRAWPLLSLFSSELLAPASPEEAEKVVRALDFAEVHVICTARDLARQIPSVWQENVKNRDATAFEAFLATLRAGELDATGRIFWDYQDLPRVLATWGASIPPEHVHVVTVPPPGSAHGLLWQRFAGVLGLDATRFTPNVPLRNGSLGLAETELLRRINLALPAEFDWPTYATLVKDDLAADLSARAGRSSVALPATEHGWVHETARRFADEVAARGYHVVGDLAELVPARPADAPPSAQPAADELVTASVNAIADLLRRWPPETVPDRGVDKARRALTTLSGRNEQVMRLRKLYWRTKAGLRSRL